VKGALPPCYVNTPVPIAYAEVDDALIVTMTRILGLCWSFDYERTPALTPDQISQLTGRPRSTLYRHLKQLREMDWIRVDQVGRRIIVRPLIAGQARPTEEVVACLVEADSQSTPKEALLQALAEIGVENPKRSQLAYLEIDPLWVRAWHLWARHPHRQSLTNPVGNIILKLENGEHPPAEFLRAAQEQIQLQEWMREQEPEDPQQDRPSELQPDSVPNEMHRLWARCLRDLQLQMTRATFDTWLRGSRVEEAGDGHLTIAVRSVYAVEWLQNRLLPVIQRTVTRHAGDVIKITFVAKTQSIRVANEENQAALPARP
jgi:DNA-binding transcriptional ArsR family regulator